MGKLDQAEALLGSLQAFQNMRKYQGEKVGYSGMTKSRKKYRGQPLHAHFAQSAYSGKESVKGYKLQSDLSDKHFKVYKKGSKKRSKNIWPNICRYKFCELQKI